MFGLHTINQNVERKIVRYLVKSYANSLCTLFAIALVISLAMVALEHFFFHTIRMQMHLHLTYNGGARAMWERARGRIHPSNKL